MIVTVTMIRHHFKGHQTLIRTLEQPSWIERLFGKKRRQVDYLGAKKTWWSYPGMRPITRHLILEELEAIERKGHVIRGSYKTDHVPIINLKR